MNDQEAREAYEAQLKKTKEYCNGLIGKTRDEATKINMANGYHTETVYRGQMMTFEHVMNRIRLHLDENNIVYHASKG